MATVVLTPLAITSAARGRSAMAETVALVAWWTIAGAAVVALVVCGPIGLTLVRMVVPVAVAAATLALALGTSTLRGVAALAVAVLATMSVFTAETGEAFVQVSAYGDERRLPLRAPAALQIPMVVSWLVWCTAVMAGVLALAADQVLLGVALLATVGIFTWFLFVRLHRFSCRWLVSVPAGVVVHDPVLLGETLMVLRPNVAQARLALADTEAADLSGPAAGHAVEVTLHEMAQIVFAATKTKPKGTAVHARSFLIAPSRPGRALHALAERKIVVAPHAG